MHQICSVCQSNEILSRDFFCTCLACGFRWSDLPVRINEENGSGLNEAARETALARIRAKNFEKILNRLETLRRPTPAALLDVGSGHGWFVSAARARGYDAIGIEPDRLMYPDRSVNNRHQHIIEGFFPDCLSGDDKFDIVTFNDVFEHLTDIGKAIHDIRKHLNEGGYLVINIPVSDGLFFKTALVASAFGVNKPMERMWQRNFPSPHLSYFNRENLIRFFKGYGFVAIDQFDLNVIEFRGAWERVRMDRSGRLESIVNYLVVVSMTLASKIMPSDTRCVVFEKQDISGS